MVGPNVRSWSEPIQMRNQSWLWMQVESAAPMPVPVQMRMPRLNMAEAWPTPASLYQPLQEKGTGQGTLVLTELEFSSPDRLGWVVDETLGEVSLNTADHVVFSRLASYADDAEGVVLPNRRPTDAS